MADSKEKTQADQLPPETSLTVVRTKEGGTREMIRAATGQFVKKPKPLLPTIEFTRKDRKFLNSPSHTKEGLTEHQHAFINMVRIAQYDGTDPKGMMAAVKAFEVYTNRALGKIASSEQDLEKLTTQPVKTVIVVAPNLKYPDIQDEKQQSGKTQPSFAEILEIKQN